MTSYLFDKAYLPTGWHRNVRITVAQDGMITAVETDISGGGGLKGLALPPFLNTHSHAFQKIFAGRTEHRAGGQDNFWTWRDEMYRFANIITPDDMKDITAFLYLEMVKAGYGAVVEFHYLHHQPGGARYDNPAEMSHAIIQAAEEVGIGLTHLPVLYMQGGFGGALLQERQLRFGYDVDSYLSLLDQLKAGPHKLGVAFHSLRAVPEAALSHVMGAIDGDMPVHIHIAEQTQEVTDCLSQTGQRSVDWLMSHCDVGPRWCLVHATHMTAVERMALAKSGAVVSICPTTEANLGDGFFPLGDFLADGGRLSIGSDSNSLISPLEEIRWLEYGARLVARQRNMAANADQPHTGAALYNATQQGGAQALGQNVGTLAVGQQADIMLLAEDSLLDHMADETILDALIFSSPTARIKDLMIGGNWRIKGEHHDREEAITARYCNVIQRLRERI